MEISMENDWNVTWKYWTYDLKYIEKSMENSDIYALNTIDITKILNNIEIWLEYDVFIVCATSDVAGVLRSENDDFALREWV